MLQVVEPRVRPCGPCVILDPLTQARCARRERGHEMSVKIRSYKLLEYIVFRQNYSGKGFLVGTFWSFITCLCILIVFFKSRIEYDPRQYLSCAMVLTDVAPFLCDFEPQHGFYLHVEAMAGPGRCLIYHAKECLDCLTAQASSSTTICTACVQRGGTTNSSTLQYSTVVHRVGTSPPQQQQLFQHKYWLVCQAKTIAQVSSAGDYSKYCLILSPDLRDEETRITGT